MDTYDLISQGVDLLKEGDNAKISRYLCYLKKRDPLAWAILDATSATARSRFPEAVKKGTRLLARVSEDSRLMVFLFNMLGIAYTKMGELSMAQGYHSKALEVAHETNNFTAKLTAQIYLFYNMVLRAEYDALFGELERSDLKDVPLVQCDFSYLYAIINLVRGKPDLAMKNLDFLEKPDLTKIYWRQGMEVRGMTLRMLKKLAESLKCLVDVARDYVDFGDAYAPFPCAKALQLSRFAGAELPPKSLIRKCLNLAEKGSWGEQAAAQEIQALLIEDDKTCAEALFAAAQSYQRATQPLEACLSGLHSAYLAWKTSSPVFPDVLKFLAPLLPIHPGFKKDPILGDFATRIEPLLATETSSSESKGIRAYLIGEFRVFVNGERLSLKGWRNNKAILALVYLLLSPQHRIPRDHLFYLLWPRRSYRSEDNRVLFYKAIYLIRRNLRDPRLLTKHRDFYQLEDTWTDLGEIENLARLADATRDPREKEEYLSRAKELANGDLLPEFPYDRHIDEYRQYYYRLRKRLFGE
ncbi:MAG: hypothetical protein ABIN66_06895 [candidate division WOR-3 bacterium]